MSATQARQRASQSVESSYGVEEEAARELREEVGRLLRHHLAAPGALEDVLDARRAEQEGAVELARSRPGLTASSSVAV